MISSIGSLKPYLTFSSKEFDKRSELSYYGFRYYDSESGRWMKKEPSGLDGPNLYHFIFNNPIIYIDFGGRYADYNSGNVFGPTQQYSGRNTFQNVGNYNKPSGNDDFGYTVMGGPDEDGIPSINPFKATGIARLSCINECDQKVTAVFKKKCVGFYAGVSFSANLLSFKDKKDCPYGYEGVFWEGSLPLVGIGGVYSKKIKGAGWGTGFGGFGILKCEYTLISDPEYK